MVMEIGRLAIKTAGREAGKKCVIVDVIDNNYVLIDGDVRRKRCNTAHLEPLAETIKIEKNASHGVIVSEFKKLGTEIKERTAKEKKENPKKIRNEKKAVEAKEDKPKKRALFTVGAKKEKKKAESKEEKKEEKAKEEEPKKKAEKRTEAKAEKKEKAVKVKKE